MNEVVEVVNRKLKIKVSGNVSILKKRYNLNTPKSKVYKSPLRKYHMMGISSPNISNVLSDKFQLGTSISKAK